MQASLSTQYSDYSYEYRYLGMHPTVLYSYEYSTVLYGTALCSSRRTDADAAADASACLLMLDWAGGSR